MSQYGSTIHPKVAPFFYIINLPLLSPLPPSLLLPSPNSLQPAIQSPSCSMNTPVTFISGSFHVLFFLPGIFFHSGGSQGLFPSWLVSILFKCLLTEDFLDLPISNGKLCLPTSGHPTHNPALFFSDALFMICCTLYFTDLFIFCLSCSYEYRLMKTESLFYFVLWFISSILNVSGTQAQISTLHASSHALSGVRLPDMYHGLTSYCLYDLRQII